MFCSVMNRFRLVQLEFNSHICRGPLASHILFASAIAIICLRRFSHLGPPNFDIAELRGRFPTTPTTRFYDWLLLRMQKTSDWSGLLDT